MLDKKKTDNFKQNEYDDKSEFIVKSWSGKPSIFCFLPKASYYFAILLIIFFINNNWIYPSNNYNHHTFYYHTAFETQKFMFFNIIETLHNIDELSWRLWALLFTLVISIVVASKILFGFMNVLLTTYAIENDQLFIKKFDSFGFMEQRAELYRIVDFSMHTPIIGILFGFANITLKSTDRSCPILNLRGIRKAEFLLDLLRNETERCRQIKGIREFTSSF